jgi:quinol monooxygenase YgiN
METCAMICVIATIEVAEGRRDELLAAFRQLVPKVLAEPGCLEYGPMVDLPSIMPAQPPERANVVTVVEKWASVEALETHLMAPHMGEFRKTTEALRVGLSLQILQPASV